MYKFQDCEFEIGKPICVMCFGYSIHGREPTSWFPVTDYDVKTDIVLKVKKSYVSEIRFSQKDHKEAYSIELENGIRLYRKIGYFIGHSPQEVRRKYREA